MIGNDFLPSVPGLGLVPDNMEILINSYKQIDSYLVYQGQLQLLGLRQLFTSLANNSNKILSTLTKYTDNPYNNNIMQNLYAKDLTPAPQFIGQTVIPVIERGVKDFDKFRYAWYSQWAPVKIDFLDQFIDIVPDDLAEYTVG